jgi:hypothetical protein
MNDAEREMNKVIRCIAGKEFSLDRFTPTSFYAGLRNAINTVPKWDVWAHPDRIKNSLDNLDGKCNAEGICPFHVLGYCQSQCTVHSRILQPIFTTNEYRAPERCFFCT